MNYKTTARLNLKKRFVCNFFFNNRVGIIWRNHFVYFNTSLKKTSSVAY